jgi:hypothetical protein
MQPNKKLRRVDRMKAQSGQPPPARSIQSILAVRSPSPPGPTIYTPIAAAAELSPSSCPSFPHPRSLTRVLSAAAARWCSASPTGSVTATRPSPTRPGSSRPQVRPICSFLLDLGGVCGFLICVAFLVVLMGLLDSCRWEACVPVHEEEGERAQVPRHREEDPGGEWLVVTAPLLCSVWCIGLWYRGGELVAMFVLLILK